MIPPDSLDAIRSRLDVAELVRDYVPGLKRVGRTLKACCPFHQERTPSFIVNQERGSFHCFGCGEGGDGFAFVMKMENLSFAEAAEKLAERTGVKITRNEGLSESERLRIKVKEALAFARDFYHKRLMGPEGKEQRIYLQDRGVNPDAMAAFGLGWAAPGADLTGQAMNQGFPAELLKAAGLASPREKGGYRDYFFRRIMYPIHDPRGAVVGFGARVFGEGEPKYLNSPDGPVFSKGRLLYGLFEGAAEIRKARRAVLVEGYMDAIAVHQAGLKLAVAPLGTALSEEHAKLLTRYIEEAVLVFDSDAAGLRAAVRSAGVLLTQGLKVRVAAVPSGKDPDEYIKAHGLEAFQKCLDQAKDPAEFQTELALAGQKPPFSAEFKSLVAGEVMATIDQCRDEIVKGEWHRRLAQRLDIPEATLRRQAQRQPARGKAAPAAASRAPQAQVLSVFDEQVLLIALKHPELAALPEASDFQSEAALRLWKSWTALEDCEPAQRAGRFLESLAQADKAIASRLLVDERVLPKPRVVLEDILKRRRLEARRKELEPLVVAMSADGRSDEGLREEYRKLILELKGGARQ